MRYLVSSAVFGLIPVPPEASSRENGENPYGVKEDACVALLAYGS
jgi:hypothetical protein